MSADIRNVPGSVVDRPSDGVQPWSKGDFYPWIVHRDEQDSGAVRHWVVSLNGEELARFDNPDDAYDMAPEFKRLDIRDRDRAFALLASYREAALILKTKEQVFVEGRKRDADKDATVGRSSLTVSKIQEWQRQGEYVPTYYSDAAAPKHAKARWWDDTQ